MVHLLFFNREEFNPHFFLTYKKNNDKVIIY